MKGRPLISSLESVFELNSPSSVKIWVLNIKKVGDVHWILKLDDFAKSMMKRPSTEDKVKVSNKPCTHSDHTAAEPNIFSGIKYRKKGAVNMLNPVTGWIPITVHSPIAVHCPLLYSHPQIPFLVHNAHWNRDDCWTLKWFFETSKTFEPYKLSI